MATEPFHARPRRLPGSSLLLIALYLICSLLTRSTTAYADAAPILFVDPGGHTARVNQVLFTPDGRELISAGNDKVIRFWDLETHATTRTLRFQIGPGPAGEIHALALDPRGKLLACGGYPAGTARQEAPITLYDTDAGKIRRLLRGHTRNVIALQFSPNGTLLASGSGDDTVRLWDAATGRPRRVLRGHRNDVYGVAFSPDGRHLASASHDRTVRVWEVATGKTVWQSAHANDVQCVAWSPDGRYVASGSLDQSVRLWNAADGHLIWERGNQGNQVECLAFSPDGTQLLGGLGGDPHASDYALRLWATANGEQRGEFSDHHSAVMSIDIRTGTGGPLVASAGEDPAELFLWDLETKKEQARLVGAGAIPWKVAWSPDGTRLAWRNSKPAKAEDPPALERSYDLRTGWPGPDVAENEPWERSAPKQGTRHLDFALEADGEPLGVVLRDNGREIARVRRNSRQAHDQVRCFTFTPGGGFVVGSLFTLALYDAQGRRQREFVGHTGQVLDVAVSRDGKFLASAGADQTIRVWPLDRRGKGGKIAPLLGFFMAENREWVSWTPEGYYACSPTGDQWVGWQLNQSNWRQARFYTAYQFRRLFFWPAVVRRVLEAGGTRPAMQLALREGKKKPRDRSFATRELPQHLAWTVRDLVRLVPPEVELLSPTPAELQAIPPTGGEVTVRARVTGDRIRRVEVRVANRPRGGPPEQLQENEWTQRVTIRPGEWISIIADNELGSESIKVRGVARAGAIPAVVIKKLYMLAIGVSNYGAELTRLQYAAKDAEDLADVYRSQQNLLFDSVAAMTLTDAQATQGGIRNALKWLSEQQINESDYVILFMAGHGLINRQETDYYFAASDCKLGELEKTGVPWDTFRDYLQVLRAKVFFIMDTCHAGLASTFSSRDAWNEVIRDSNANVGLITFAACAPHEGSYEASQKLPDLQNGVFTRALIEALAGKGKGPTDAKREVDINETAYYINARVRELTDDKQNPPQLGGTGTIKLSLPLARLPAATAPGASNEKR